MTRILCIPDLHCWYDNHSRDEGGIPSRLVDWRRTADALVQLARDQTVDLAVAPGDFFVTPRPPARAIIEVANLFRRIEALGIPVVGCCGNHDVAGPGQPGPVDVIADLGNHGWGITRPQVVHVVPANLQVAVLPWAKPAALLEGSESAGDVVQRTTEALISITRALAAQCDPSRAAILIGHWAIAGCTMSSGLLLTGGEAALPVSELASLPFEAVIMGHIHRPQIFPTRATGRMAPAILHTGALERRDFGEERDPRGAYIVDTRTGDVDWFDLPARRFCTVRYDATALEWIAGGGAPDVPLYDSNGGTWDPIEGAICRVVYRATEEVHRQIDQAAIFRTLERLGAHQVAGVYPEIVRSERARVSGLTEQTSPVEALSSWLDLHTHLSPELKAEVRAAFAMEMEEEGAGCRAPALAQT